MKSAPQPDDFLHPEILLEGGFHLLPREVGISALAEQAFLGDHNRAFAVRAEGTALHYKLPQGVVVDAGHLAYLFGHQAVGVPGEVKPLHQTSVAVKGPADSADL